MKRLICLLCCTSALVSCGWTYLDAVELADAGLRRPDAGHALDAALVADSAPDVDVEPDAAYESIGDGRAAVGDAETEHADSGPGAPLCSSSLGAVRQWSFDADEEGWALEKDEDRTASVSWNQQTGRPTPGVLVLDGEPGAGDAVWVAYAEELGDLRGHTLSAWVWLEAGTSLKLKMFAQTGAEFSWADGGIVELAPGVWTCLSLRLSEPSYRAPKYDPVNVVRMGFELLLETSARMYVDSVRID